MQIVIPLPSEALPSTEGLNRRASLCEQEVMLLQTPIGLVSLSLLSLHTAVDFGLAQVT